MCVANKRKRRKTSIIWTIAKSDLEQIISMHNTYSSILQHLNYTVRGGAFRMLKERIKIDEIDDSHLHKAGSQIIFAQRFNRIPDVDVFVENSTYQNGQLIKQRLLKIGVPHQCSVCGIGNEWNGQMLSLQLDHINGIRNDNRVENLRIVCPNCHSQTHNFAGKKNVKESTIKKREKVQHNGKTVSIKQKCYFDSITGQPRYYNRIAERPDKETLEKMLWEMPTTKIANTYSVSDKAVEKWAKAYDLNKPPRGYWAKQQISPRSSPE